MPAALRLPESDSRLRLESERLLESLRFMLLCKLMCSCQRFQLRPPEGECTPAKPRCLHRRDSLIVSSLQVRDLQQWLLSMHARCFGKCPIGRVQACDSVESTLHLPVARPQHVNSDCTGGRATLANPVVQRLHGSFKPHALRRLSQEYTGRYTVGRLSSHQWSGAADERSASGFSRP